MGWYLIGLIFSDNNDLCAVSDHPLLPVDCYAHLGLET